MEKIIALKSEDHNRSSDYSNEDFTYFRMHLWFALCGRFLTSRAKVVYMALASFADSKSRRCWPSLPVLAERAGLGRTTVWKALEELEYFSYVTKATEKGVWSSRQKKFVWKNQYHLCLPPSELHPTKQAAAEYAAGETLRHRVEAIFCPDTVRRKIVRKKESKKRLANKSLLPVTPDAEKSSTCSDTRTLTTPDLGSKE